MSERKRATRDPVLVAKAVAAALVLLADASLLLFGGAVASGLLQIGRGGERPAADRLTAGLPGCHRCGLGACGKPANDGAYAPWQFPAESFKFPQSCPPEAAASALSKGCLGRGEAEP
jgi:hypothetical protein